MMNKIKIGFILFLLLIARFNTPLSAKDHNPKFFLNLTTYAFENFAFGAGVELRLHKSVSIKSTLDLPTTGGRIIYLDGVFTFNTSKKVKPFITIGYLDYFFKGNSSHDRDAVKSLTFGIGIDYNSNSLGVRILNSEGTTFPYFYCSLILLKL